MKPHNDLILPPHHLKKDNKQIKNKNQTRSSDRRAPALLLRPPTEPELFFTVPSRCCQRNCDGCCANHEIKDPQVVVFAVFVVSPTEDRPEARSKKQEEEPNKH